MKKQLLVLCMLATGITLANAQQQQQRQRQRPVRTGTVTDPNTHDPVMAKQGDTYYLYATGWNVSCMSSKDLVNWSFEKPVLDKTPQWAMDSITGYRGHTWAPDIIYHNGYYHIFYSCSSFGKNTSAIGHAYCKSLNPADSLKWTDTGMVVSSRPGDNYNAIDPNVIIDEKGKPWMTFGSFWGGMQLVPLTDDMTSILPGSKPETICTRVAPGQRGTNAVEAPFLFKKNDMYYLFVSYDFCCRGLQSNYRVVVGRSKDIKGPYLDKDGKSLMEGGGTHVVASSKEFVAIGHSAAYTFDGKDYFVAHGYDRDQNGASKLVLEEMKWDADGWPIVNMP